MSGIDNTQTGEEEMKYDKADIKHALTILAHTLNQYGEQDSIRFVGNTGRVLFNGEGVDLDELSDVLAR